LQLVELIRTCTSSPGGDITPALNFATSQLGPRASKNGQFLEDLEKTMTLLVFPHDSLDPTLAALLQPSLRREVADQVNKTILERQYHRRDAAIRNLLMMRAWSELTARNESKKDLPARIELGLDGDEEDKQENGHDAMITT
jgi:glucose-induced degradation protein 8